MFYTAVHNDSAGRPSDLGHVRALLALATATVSNTSSSVHSLKNWKLHGPLFPSIDWSKSGALLPSSDLKKRPHYLYWGDSDISLAESVNLINYTNKNVFIKKRPDFFDSELIESGPGKREHLCFFKLFFNTIIRTSITIQWKLFILVQFCSQNQQAKPKTKLEFGI